MSGLGWKRGGHQLMCKAVCYSKDRRRTLKHTDNCVHYGAFKIEIAKECKPTDQIVCPRFMCVLFIEWAQWQPLMYSHRCCRCISCFFIMQSAVWLSHHDRHNLLFVTQRTCHPELCCRMLIRAVWPFCLPALWNWTTLLPQFLYSVFQPLCPRHTSVAWGNVTCAV